MQRKIGITLSGGGTRGMAHLGVLHGLEELGIIPHQIAGVSAGALVGALYSAGNSPEKILKLLQEIKWTDLIRPTFFQKMGFFDIEKIRPLLHKHLKVHTFEALNIPFFVGTTDIELGESLYFSTGELITPLLASMCVPALFSPVPYQNRLLVDGGITNGMITDPLSECEAIIGIHVNPFDKQSSFKSTKDILERCFTLALHGQSRKQFECCNVVIEPLALCQYNAFQWHNPVKMYEIGYNATIDKKQEILNLL
jgi:NTE family protein